MFSKKFSDLIFSVAFAELLSPPAEGTASPAKPARPAYLPRAPEIPLDAFAGANIVLETYMLGKDKLYTTPIIDIKAVKEKIFHLPRNRTLKISKRSNSLCRLSK